MTKRGFEFPTLFQLLFIKCVREMKIQIAMLPRSALDDIRQRSIHILHFFHMRRIFSIIVPGGEGIAVFEDIAPQLRAREKKSGNKVSDRTFSELVNLRHARYQYL